MPWARIAPALVFAAALAVIGAALGFQYIGGLVPCPLCLYQRIPYWVVLGLAALAVVLAGRPPAGTALMAATAMVFMAGAGIAAYHVAVQEGWLTPASACAGAGPVQSIEELKARLEATPLARCDEVAWRFLGLSMAGWNLVVSLVLAGGSAYVAHRTAHGGWRA